MRLTGGVQTPVPRQESSALSAPCRRMTPPLSGNPRAELLGPPHGRLLGIALGRLQASKGVYSSGVTHTVFQDPPGTKQAITGLTSCSQSQWPWH